MGIITLALIVGNLQDGNNVEPQVWVKVAYCNNYGIRYSGGLENHQNCRRKYYEN